MYRIRNKIWPKIIQDAAAYIFLVACVFSVLVFDAFVVLPDIGCTLSMWYVHVSCGLFIVFNIIGNLHMLMAVETSTSGLLMPTAQKPGWHFCTVCESNSPPRSFHCRTCHRCILKRDHHCLFSGCCIGYYNQRFYVLLLAHLVVGCAYSTVLNTQFIWKILEGGNVVAYLFPFVYLVLGYIDVKAFTWTFLSSVTFFGLMFVLGLLIYHLLLVVKNQTTFEKNYKVTHYDLGWRRNLLEVFGYNWRLVWLVPFVSSKLPGDGIEFKGKEDLALSSRKAR